MEPSRISKSELFRGKFCVMDKLRSCSSGWWLFCCMFDTNKCISSGNVVEENFIFYWHNAIGMLSVGNIQHTDPTLELGRSVSRCSRVRRYPIKNVIDLNISNILQCKIEWCSMGRVGKPNTNLRNGSLFKFDHFFCRLEVFHY